MIPHRFWSDPILPCSTMNVYNLTPKDTTPCRYPLQKMLFWSLGQKLQQGDQYTYILTFFLGRTWYLQVSYVKKN